VTLKSRELNLEALIAKRSTGVVKNVSFHSKALGVEKKYRIYLPPGYYSSEKRYPVLYLFRGHEKEWFDPEQDYSRGGKAVQHLADELIADGRMCEMIIVGPSMTSDDGSIYGLGVNFINPEAAKDAEGIGDGQFEDYFCQDVIQHIDSTYRTIKGVQAADGFSLGGFTSLMLAIKHPGLFCSVGSYDGSHMFRSMNDPRYPGLRNDTLWLRRDQMFAPAFRRPGTDVHDLEHLLSYNLLNILEGYTKRKLEKIRACRYFITTACADGMEGNRDRGVHVVSVFQQYEIVNQADELVLSNDALHNWHFSDLHLRRTLQLHSEAFLATGKIDGQLKPPLDDHIKDFEFTGLRESTPDNRDVILKFRVYRKTGVRVDIHAVDGKRVKTLTNTSYDCGHHEVRWNGDTGSGLASSGVYYIQAITKSGYIRRKVVFLR